MRQRLRPHLAFANVVSMIALLVALVLAATTLARTTTTTELISVSFTGAPGNGISIEPSTSAHGRYVAFTSLASNLVGGDSNGVGDVFVRDRRTGETSRVSVSSAGTQANDVSFDPSISADGRYVAFESGASNLVAGDTNGFSDIFVHDRKTGETSRVSVSSAGVQANNESSLPDISDRGRYVAFVSTASNLVGGDTHNTLFVHDRKTAETREVVNSAGGGNPSISANGRYVAFDSFNADLVAGDTNDTGDVFVSDRRTGTTSRVSVSTAGVQGNGFSADPSISGDGRYVAFESRASNLVGADTNDSFDVFVHERKTDETSRVSVSSAGVQGNDDSVGPSISAHGRFVAFESDASNLVAGDTNGFSDIFVNDRRTGKTSRVSVSIAGAQGNFGSRTLSISADGRYVAFSSTASNLVAGDTTEEDVFIRGRLR